MLTRSPPPPHHIYDHARVEGDDCFSAFLRVIDDGCFPPRSIPPEDDVINNKPPAGNEFLAKKSNCQYAMTQNEPNSHKAEIAGRGFTSPSEVNFF